MTQSAISQLVAKLRSAKQAGQFDPFIDFIQFPKYRNFQPGARINFNFPLTVIVGQNGSGKTSLLHALSGCPQNKSVGVWWFATQLDPIDGEDGDNRRQTLAEEHKSAFWYQYTTANTKHQVLKMRIRRPGDPDYWEPSRPVQKHGMTLLQGKGRSPTIAMEVAYFNFKTQLNAFDRCLHFYRKSVLKDFEKKVYWTSLMRRAKARAPRMSDYFRFRSRKLRRVFDGKTVKSGRHEMHKPVIKLTDVELSAVSTIIGRKYSAGLIVEHRFYEDWGTSVLFTDAQRSYSEANAGSGEAAVVRLVHEITTSPPGRLILLDEPETSLHPGAQEQLLLFLLKNVLEKKLQVVVSTHSPAFIRHLPPEAIKVLESAPDGTIKVVEGVTADESFYTLGHPPENKIHVIVEDVLAKTLANAVLNEQGVAFASKFAVQFRHGGESGIKQDAAVFMTVQGPKPYLILDGDKQPQRPQFDVASITRVQTADDLSSVIKHQLGCDIALKQDSNMSDDDKKSLRVKFMEFCNERLKYFPFPCPEEAIWNDDVVKNIVPTLLSPSLTATTLQSLAAERDFKKKFDILTKAIEPINPDMPGATIQAIHGMFITKFCTEKGSTYSAIVTLLRGLV